MMINDDEELDISMTMIIGIKTEDGLIVASDGMAAWDTRGQEHLPKKVMTNMEKVHTVSPRVVYGVSGSMVNWHIRLRNEIASLLNQNPDALLKETATYIATQFIPTFYADRIDNPNFFIALFFAGYGKNDTEPTMYQITNGEVRAWGDDHPWMTTGTDNERPDIFIKERYTGKLLPKAEAITLLKDAIADTAKHNPEAVGGHTFVYEITESGVTRLE